tara:strand:- start:1202 stop:1615 length:414 start_codon:yes stop_codon:yes gene_type:complete
MGYTIELSFNLRKKGDLTETRRVFEEKALQHGCENFYYNYEMSGHGRTLKRSHYVMTFIFEENDEEVAKFLKFCKAAKYVYIESVSYENTIVQLMYASKQYLNMMEKEFAKLYYIKKRNGLLYNKDSPIMKEIYAKN